MRYLLIIISVILICFSCKKKGSNEPEETQAPAPPTSSAYTVKDYMPLKYGNYWVYQLTISDTNNVVTSTILDSCYVSDSTIVRGRKFYLVNGSNPYTGYFADSAGYMIFTNGKKALSLINNDTLITDFQTFGTGWYNSYIIMKTTPSVFSFNSNTYSNCVKRHNYFYSNMNPNCPDWILDNTYCPGVGMVYCMYGFINSCDHWELKLLRYKIN